MPAKVAIVVAGMARSYDDMMMVWIAEKSFHCLLSRAITTLSGRFPPPDLQKKSSPQRTRGPKALQPPENTGFRLSPE